jgi:Fe-S oxidoreductase
LNPKSVEEGVNLQAAIKLDPTLRKEVAEKVGFNDFERCLFCGMCTAGCPFSGLREDIDPRKFMRQIALGMREEVLNSQFMWLCTVCERCTMNCPMNVNMAMVVHAIRGKFGIKPPGDLMYQCRAVGGSKSLMITMADWLKSGRIKVDPALNPEPVTYHDPCNLGRKEEIVDQPRIILSSVCADFRDMRPGGRYNYCCGNSGGALLAPEHDELRMSMGKLKAEQIKETGARIVATACLNCVEQLEEINKKYDLDVQVKYVHELVDRALVGS